jgi:Ras-related protein Rab-19
MPFSSSAREADENFDYLFKVILIGDSNVGKTCVVQHFKSGVYTETQQNTIGVDFTVRSLEIDGKKVKVRRALGLARPLLARGPNIQAHAYSSWTGKTAF